MGFLDDIGDAVDNAVDAVTGGGSSGGGGGGGGGQTEGEAAAPSVSDPSGGGGGSSPSPSGSSGGGGGGVPSFDLGGGGGGSNQTEGEAAAPSVSDPEGGGGGVTPDQTDAEVAAPYVSDPLVVPDTGFDPKGTITPDLPGADVDTTTGTDTDRQPDGPRQLDTISNITGSNVTVQRGEQFGDAEFLDGVETFVDFNARALSSTAKQFGEFIGSGVDNVVTNSAAANPSLSGTSGEPTNPDTADTPAGELTRGAAQSLALPGQVASAGVEAAEAGVFTARQPGTAASRVDDVATRAVLTTAEGAASDPFGTAGQAIAAAGISRSAFGAARGTRLKAPTKTALQPIEETAKALARRGTIKPSTATKIPGVKENQPGVPPVDRGEFDQFQRPDLGSGGTGSPLARADDSTDTPAGLDRGDTPTRPGGDSGGVPSDSGDISAQVRVDSDVTETPQLGTQPSDPGSSLDEIAEAVESGAIGQARPKIRNLENRLNEFEFQESRAQASLKPRGRRREATEPELGEDRVSPNLRQQTITRRQRNLRDAADDSSFDGERSPFASDSARARRRRDLDRIDDAQRRFDRRDLTGRAGAAGAVGGLFSGGGVGTGTGLDVDDVLGADQPGDTRVDQPTDTDTDTGTSTDTDTDVVTPRADVRETETPREGEFKTDIGIDTPTDIGTTTFTPDMPESDENDEPPRERERGSLEGEQGRFNFLNLQEADDRVEDVLDGGGGV